MSSGEVLLKYAPSSADDSSSDFVQYALYPLIDMSEAASRHHSYRITGILNVFLPLMNQCARAPNTTAPNIGPA